MNKDTLIVTLSDMHTGSTVSLCPDRFMTFAKQGNNHTPNSKQQEIYKHFEFCAGEINKARKNKRLIIVSNGDAVEGWHHNYSQLIPCTEKEQADLHIELMVHFKKWVDYKRGDELHYTVGTEVHVDDWEHYIGEQIGAVQYDDGLYAIHDLKLDVNGQKVWWTHKGPAKGKGANKGNAIRNWLKNIFYDIRDEGDRPPNMIITSHYHDPFYQPYVGRYKGNYHLMHGLISPSWQQKTIYANGVAPFGRNKIGLQYFTVSADGFILCPPVELVM